MTAPPPSPLARVRITTDDAEKIANRAEEALRESHRVGARYQEDTLRLARDLIDARVCIDSLTAHSAAVAALVEAADELADLVDLIRDGGYEPDSLTTQPVRVALSRLAALEDGA